MIHDVETLRLFKDDHEFVANELQIFNEVDGIIDHNKKMHAWLQAQGIKTPIVDLGLFDYHNPIKLDETYTFDRSVVFAGNLEKSKFLTKLAEVDFQMKLFGPNPHSLLPPSPEYFPDTGRGQRHLMIPHTHLFLHSPIPSIRDETPLSAESEVLSAVCRFPSFPLRSEERRVG